MIALWAGLALAGDTVRLDGTVSGAHGAPVRIEVLQVEAGKLPILLASTTLEGGETVFSIEVPAHAGPVRLRAAVDTRGDGIDEQDLQALWPESIRIGDQDQGQLGLLIEAR